MGAIWQFPRCMKLKTNINDHKGNVSLEGREDIMQENKMLRSTVSDLDILQMLQIIRECFSLRLLQENHQGFKKNILNALVPQPAGF